MIIYENIVVSGHSGVRACSLPVGHDAHIVPERWTAGGGGRYGKGNIVVRRAGVPCAGGGFCVWATVTGQAPALRGVGFLIHWTHYNIISPMDPDSDPSPAARELPFAKGAKYGAALRQFQMRHDVGIVPYGW